MTHLILYLHIFALSCAPLSTSLFFILTSIRQLLNEHVGHKNHTNCRQIETVTELIKSFGIDAAMGITITVNYFPLKR